MKLSLRFLTVMAAFSIMTASCGKDENWRCDCEVNGIITQHATYEDMDRKTAANNCAQIDNNLDTAGSTASCILTEY